MLLIYRAAVIATTVFSLLALTACDPQRISELKEGVSTEADVRDRFGAPENVWDEPGGARTLEYNRQPAGQVNYMITIGADGHMTALRQVLTPDTFARVVPGMRMDEVRRMLGKPAKVTPYELKKETWADWRFLASPNQAQVFTVIYGPDQFVLRTQTGADMDAPEFKGGK
ncbi:Beta-barrel assembly machine subunit BamE [Acidovorax sp. 69]|uniref:outer membrane protein assembly factor BamE n=1 Tax=Acidovorax sp. 69 TaxID=2035202 RepID=UPI000C248131|nr:outer membrane protein assembly factor BamE [Acidovorax sp. 69]PJI96396.1 Beta-barrel assembly machine subunit BamE [Acidovorax sp. 69]